MPIAPLLDRTPRFNRRFAYRLVAVVAAVVAAATVAVAPAGAATTITNCGFRTTSQSLLGLGDDASYYLAQGGSFDPGRSPWALNQASVVAGNEPWNVVPGANNSSLQIRPGGSAVSGYDCNANGEDVVRFFYRSPGVPGSRLHVSIAVMSSVGITYQTYDLSGAATGWTLSRPLQVPNQRGGAGVQVVTLTISAAGTAATWQIDDVLVDPWRAL
jgi:hypothetical protein